MEKMVSIIIPIYNVEEFLGKCILSLINQTYKNIEILLINDGSKDKSGQICEEYAKKDNRIKVFHKKNGGVSSARNLGLKNANGEYISFVDPDDYVENKFIELLVKCQNDCTNENTFTLCGFYRVEKSIIIDKNISEKPINLSREEYIKHLLLEDDLGGGVCWNKLFPKKIVEGIYFDENINVGEDLKFIYAVSKKIDSVNIISQQLYYSILRTGSLSKTYNSSNLLQESKLCEGIMNDLKNTGNYEYAVKRYLLSITYLFTYDDISKYKNVRRKCIKLLPKIIFLKDVSLYQKNIICIKILIPNTYIKLKKIKDKIKR